jgi:phosphohistidine swiveling domain-containing protein
VTDATSPRSPTDLATPTEVAVPQPDEPQPAQGTTDDFPVEWPDPAFASISWWRDETHLPYALTPLAQDYAEVMGSGFRAGYEFFDSLMQFRLLVVNGWAYLGLDYGTPDADTEAIDDQVAKVARAFGPKTSAYWAQSLAELQDLYAGIARIDVDGLSAADLGAAWQRAWPAVERAWAIHFVVTWSAYQLPEDLTNLYKAAIPVAPTGEGARLIQGANDVLQDIQTDVEALTSLAAARPDLARRLRREPRPSVEELAPVDGGVEFAAALQRFLAKHGHMGQAFDDLTLPSWADEPTILLGEIAQRLARPPERAAERRAQLRAEADRLADRVRSALADKPAELATFEETLRLAREIGPLTETHNYWIDRMAQARLHALAVRVGHRLVREGSIDQPDDVFFLHRDEIPGLLLAPITQAGVVAERKAQRERQLRLKPPRFLGKIEEPAATNSTSAELTANELRGVGASAGTVRGPARVALGPKDFGRIEAGDIIVCPASNPSWVPVFAIAGGLVTNVGGILAHAAVVAREFGLPAVVGVTGATSRIADGQLVEIDGTQGIVRLL